MSCIFQQNRINIPINFMNEFMLEFRLRFEEKQREPTKTKRNYVGKLFGNLLLTFLNYFVWIITTTTNRFKRRIFSCVSVSDKTFYPTVKTRRIVYIILRQFVILNKTRCICFDILKETCIKMRNCYIEKEDKHHDVQATNKQSVISYNRRSKGQN